MSAPRLEIDLDRIEDNARLLVGRLAERGISVTGITKAVLGSPEVARALLRGGVRGIGDSRVENLEALRAAGVPGPMTLVRAPMPSQVERVVRAADVSCNTEPAAISALSAAAVADGRVHGVVLMVELGDLREGILPDELEQVVAGVLRLPGIRLRGLGANLACQHGITPDRTNMAELSRSVDAVEAAFGVRIDVVSGGNSANLVWALDGDDVGRVDDLRLGESILLGRQPLDRSPIPGLHTDAVTLVGEVIEASVKPSQPWGAIARTAFGEAQAVVDRGPMARVLVAVGRQDVDPEGLEPPAGVRVLGASSDHLVLDAGATGLAVGDEVRLGLDYSGLLRAATSPYVTRAWCAGAGKISAERG